VRVAWADDGNILNTPEVDPEAYRRSSPIEPHGFREPSSWLDEYRRILKLFEESSDR
jgi:hypothetical protein